MKKFSITFFLFVLLIGLLSLNKAYAYEGLPPIKSVFESKSAKVKGHDPELESTFSIFAEDRVSHQETLVDLESNNPQIK